MLSNCPCSLFLLLFLMVGMLALNTTVATSTADNEDSQKQFEHTQKFKNDQINERISEYKASQLAKSTNAASCRVSVHESDHLLFEYHIEYKNGTILPLVNVPNQRQHVHFTSSDFGSLPIYDHILGMCEESTKSISANIESDFRPFVAPQTIPDLAAGESCNLVLTLAKVTTEKDFQIFQAIKAIPL